MGGRSQIDVVLIHPQTRKTLGIECKVQLVSGSAEEKIPSTVQDIGAWPIPGIVVFAGDGFSENMKNYLIASGKAVVLEDLDAWLCLFFGLSLEQGSAQLPLNLVPDRHLPRQVDSPSPELDDTQGPEAGTSRLG